GWPAFGAAAIVQTPAGSVASIVDSIGDNFSCARLAGTPVPDRLFTTIPQSIAGGMCCAMFGMIAAVGLLNLHVVDHTSMKILFILTFVFFVACPSPSI
ncbi:MAG: solute carrier family 23 protein, partial [Myxococcota bacterium]